LMLQKVAEFAHDNIELRALDVNKEVFVILSEYVKYFEVYGVSLFDCIVIQRTSIPVFVLVNVNRKDPVHFIDSVIVKGVVDGYDFNGFKNQYSRSMFIEITGLRQQFIQHTNQWYWYIGKSFVKFVSYTPFLVISLVSMAVGALVAVFGKSGAKKDVLSFFLISLMFFLASFF